MRTVPSTAEILPCIVTKPAFPAFCSSVEPTESNVPAIPIFVRISVYQFSYITIILDYLGK